MRAFAALPEDFGFGSQHPHISSQQPPVAPVPGDQTFPSGHQEYICYTYTHTHTHTGKTFIHIK